MEDNSLPPVQPVQPGGSSDSLDGTDAGAPVSSYSVVQKAYPVESLEVHSQGGQMSGGAGSPVRGLSFSRRKAVVVSLAITFVVILITGLSTVFVLSRNKKAGDLAAQLDIPSQDVSFGQNVSVLPPELQGAEESLLVRGDIITRGNLKVTSGSFVSLLRTQDLTANQTLILPNNSGIICLDVNNCNFSTQDQYNQHTTEINNIQAQLGQVVTPPSGVTTLNNQAGAVSIQGSVNQVSVTTTGGTITLSTPQALDANANVQFGNLTLGDSLSLSASGQVSANTLQQTAAGNDLALNAGNDDIIFTVGGRTFQLPTSGPGTQTVCTTAVGCGGGGGGSVDDINGQTGSVTLQGTTNQITVNTGVGTITLSTPQNINTTSSPTFAGLTLSSPLGISSGGTGLAAMPTNGQLLIGNGSGYSLSTLANAGGVVITNGAGTIGLAVSYGSAGNTAVRGNTVLTCASGSGNLTGGGNAVTLGAGGSCNNISIVNNPTFSTSVTTPSLVLSGAGSNGTLQVASLGQPTTYTLPDPGTGSVTICLSSGNCAGSGTGVTASTPGTTGRLPVFTGAQSVANSWLNQNSSTLELDNTRNLSLLGGNLSVTGTALATGTVTSNTELRVLESTGGTFYGILDVGDLAADQTFTFLQGGTVVTSGNVSSFATTGVTAGAGLSGGGTIGALALDIGAGNGVTVNANDITLALQASKGLEVDGNGLSLIDCSSGEILKYNGSNQWACAADAGGSGVGDDISVNGVAATNANFIDTAASGTDAAVTWTLNTVPSPDSVSITIGNASGTTAGTVSTGAQTFAGAKTFNGQISAGGGVALGTQTLSGTTAVIDFTNFDVSSAGVVTAASDVVVQGGDITVGTASQVASLVLHDGDGETVTWTLPDVSSSYTLTLPSAVGGTNQCLKAQDGTGTLFWDNCTGGSSGGLGGSGTLNRVAKFTPNGTTIGDTTITDDGTNVSIAGDFTVQGGDVSLGTSGTAGALLLSDGSSNTATLNTGALSGNRVYTFPDVGGNADVCLSTGNCVGGGGGSAPSNAEYMVLSLSSNLSNERALVLGGNLTAVDGGANGNYTVNTVQNPTFTTSVTTPILTSAGVLTVTPGGAMTLGATGQTALLQGATTTVTSTGVGNDIVLNSADTIELQDNTNVTGTLNVSVNADVAGHLAVGNAASPGLKSVMTLAETYTGTDCDSGCYGLFSLAVADALSGSNNVLAGVYGQVSVASGNVGSSIGLHAANPTGGGTLLNNYGIFVENMTKGSTADYGVYIQGADTYALWVDSGVSRFDGNLEFEGATDDAAEFTLVVADPTADRTYTIPNSSASTDTFCLVTLANCTGGATGDDVSVNGVAVTNANFLNAAASGTSASTTWGLNTASSPDDITLTVGNASATTAGAVTTGIQTFAGAKTFNGQIVAGGGVDLGSQTLQGTSAVIDFTNFDVSSAGVVTAGTYNGQTISSAANFTGTVAVATSLTAPLLTSTAGLVVTSATTLTLQSAAGTTSSAVTLQSGNASSGVSGSITIDNGTFTSGTPTINIGTTNARAINIGNSSTNTAVTIQGDGTSTAVSIQSAASGTISIGTANVATKTISIGSVGSTAQASTINIGNTTGNATQLINIGATNSANNAVLIQGGTSASAVSIQAGTSGTVSVGTATNAQTINIGNGTSSTAVSVACGTGTCGFGNNAVAHSTILGSATGTAATTIQAGTDVTNSKILFNTNATTRMDIDRDGAIRMNFTDTARGILTIGDRTTADVGTNLALVNDATPNTAVGSRMKFDAKNGDGNWRSQATIIGTWEDVSGGGKGMLTFNVNNDSLVERLRISSTKTVFNNNGDDTDFQMQGDTQANLFYMDASTDRIGIGTNAPGYRFDVNTDTASSYVANFFNDGNDANRYGIRVQAGADDGSGTTYYLDAYDGDGTQVGYLANTSGTFAVTDVSDIRTKTNIQDTSVGGLDVLNGLHIVDFNRLQNPDGPRITGFIAQEVQDVYGQAVTQSASGLLGVQKEAFIPVLVKGVQELSVKTSATDARIDSVESVDAVQGADILNLTSQSSALSGRADDLATRLATVQAQISNGQFSQLNVSGSSTLTGLAVTGTATVEHLVAKNAEITDSLTINGHIITGNKAGNTSVVAGAGGCGGSATLHGNDTSGTITVQTGAAACAPGTLATVTFATPFGASPRIVLTPASASSATLQYYTGATNTTSFTVDAAAPPAAATTYTYNYQVMQ